MKIMIRSQEVLQASSFFVLHSPLFYYVLIALNIIRRTIYRLVLPNNYSFSIHKIWSIIIHQSTHQSWADNINRPMHNWIG